MDDTQLLDQPTETAQEILAPSPPVLRKPSLEAGADVAPIIPRTVDEVGRLADAIIAANMVPNSYDASDDLPPVGQQMKAHEVMEWRRGRTKARIMIGVMKGLEVGFGPVTALSTICIINNQPQIWGDGAVALALRDGKMAGQKHWYEGKPYEDNYTCHFQAWRRGSDKVYEWEFSVARAKKAGLWGNTKKAPWIQHPDKMLFNRARAVVLRNGFADCLMGMSIAEESLDLDPAADSKPKDTSFLDDAPSPVAIEHKPEMPMPSPAPAAEPVPANPRADAATQQEPEAAQEAPPVAARDWTAYERDICAEINDAAPHGAIPALMTREAQSLQDAPRDVSQRIRTHAQRASKGKR